MPNFSFTCTTCSVTSYEVYRYEERPASISCPCGGLAPYRIDAPNLTKASYVDGTKRRGFAELKEANKLTREANTSSRETAKEIRQEIKKMGVRVEK